MSSSRVIRLRAPFPVILSEAREARAQSKDLYFPTSGRHGGRWEKRNAMKQRELFFACQHTALAPVLELEVLRLLRDFLAALRMTF